MIGACLALAAFAQQGGWTVAPHVATVGDTVRIERLVPAVPGATGRTAPLDATDLLEPLRAPELVGVRGALLVRHTVALFAPGEHRLPMPPIELVEPDGQVELVEGDTATVTIVSVLPGPGDTPAPKASLGPFARSERRPEPPVALGAAVLLLLGVWGWRRRAARPPPPPPPPPPVTEPAEPPLMRWIAAGEPRAVATLASHRVRAHVAERVPRAVRSLDTTECLAVVAAEMPAWPLDELEDVLTTLDRSRFAPLTPSDAAELADRVELLLPRLTDVAPEEAA